LSFDEHQDVDDCQEGDDAQEYEFCWHVFSPFFDFSSFLFMHF